MTLLLFVRLSSIFRVIFSWRAKFSERNERNEGIWGILSKISALIWLKHLQMFEIHHIWDDYIFGKLREQEFIFKNAISRVAARKSISKKLLRQMLKKDCKITWNENLILFTLFPSFVCLCFFHGGALSKLKTLECGTFHAKDDELYKSQIRWLVKKTQRNYANDKQIIPLKQQHTQTIILG